MSKKVLVGLSGGVDSAVCTYLLKKSKYDVECAFMHNWQSDPHSHCQSHEDYSAAVDVAKTLDVKLHSVDFSHEYNQQVFQPFLDALSQNKTPNPDVLCNKKIKFDCFLKFALSLGFDYIATGHYAKKQSISQRHFLCKAKDSNKDQTYFLHQLNQFQLKHTLFPLGDYLKPEIKSLAASIDLKNSSRKESMGICFIGQKKFSDFIKPYLLEKPGDIVDIDGHVLGRHNGLYYYTIGQRKGIGIGGLKNYMQNSWYVIQKDYNRNQLVVAQDADHPKLYSQKLLAEQMHWIANDINPALPVFARIRHRQALQKCQVLQKESKSIEVHFEQPQRAVTAGQSIVLYQENYCLGGATITV